MPEATRLPVRTRAALAAAASARWASRAAGRGKGSMIGGLIAEKIDPRIMSRLAAGRTTALITGTNGKSTTTRMTAAALAPLGEVATQADGANMDAGIIATLSLQRDARIAALEVDELHVANVAANTAPAVFTLLNLSRDQLDRVGEINIIEQSLRGAIAARGRRPSSPTATTCWSRRPRSTHRTSSGWLPDRAGSATPSAARARVSP